MDENRTFVGTVNGKTYDSVVDYNRAFRDALGKNGTVTASIEFKPANQEALRDDRDRLNTRNEFVTRDKPGVLRYGRTWPFFDLDKLRGTAEVDEPTMTNFLETYMSPTVRDSLIRTIQNCGPVAQERLRGELNNLISRLKEDFDKNLEAHNKLIQTRIQKLERRADVQLEFNRLQQKLHKMERELDSIQDEIAAIETKDNITEGAGRVLDREIGFYSDISQSVGGGRTDKMRQKLNPNVTGRTVDKGNPGFILDHDQKELARKLFKEIFGA